VSNTDDPERRWLAEVYKPGVPQLTVRAVLAGMILGMVMCLSNLYVVLKTGWSFGVTITASILAFAIFAILRRLGAREYGPLENNAMASVASAAGYMTGGGNMAAFPALLMLTAVMPDPVWMVAWFAVIAALGVFAAIPIKRQLINVEQLAFPTGTATAETIRSLHSHGEATGQARLLGWSGLVGALVAILRDVKAVWMPFNLPGSFGLPFQLAGHAAAKWTLAVEASLILIGGGMLMSFRTGWSMLLGAVGTYAVIAPRVYEAGIITTVSYKTIVQWTVWPGAAILLVHGLGSFAFQWRSVGRALSGLSSAFRSRVGNDPLADIECPPGWFPLGFAILGPIIIFLMWFLFGIPWWAGALTLPLAFFMGVVAARVTGETDTTPTKALGPVTQMIYGVLRPGDVTANVMGANVTGGVGLHSADLLTDLKSGYLLGANPRQQFIGQLFGCVAGAAIVVPAFQLLIPDASILGGEQFPAPSAQVWAGVSKILSTGLQGLHPSALLAMKVGAVVGLVLLLLERFVPAKHHQFIPSAPGLGLAMVIPGTSSIGFFLGTLVAAIFRLFDKKVAEKVNTPVGSGFLAGESLMGIAIALLVAFGILSR
jgi:uncharacterized oligopeptide transporter (OPT) family protein